MDIRVGNGFDVHALVEGRALVLGGVRIPYERGLLGHSDADVLLHALCDAMLGALALGDIGAHFPDTDARWKGVDSRLLLRQVAALARERGWRAGNIDTTLVAQAPKVAPYVATMRANIAADVGCAVDAVGVKATTTERLGFTGRGEGIAALATVLMVRDGGGGAAGAIVAPAGGTDVADAGAHGVGDSGSGTGGSGGDAGGADGGGGGDGGS